MSSDSASEPTRLLHSLNAGDPEAAEKLLPFVYDELHRMAHRMMQGERPDHTLQPTALIHEAWMRLIGTEDQRFESRMHFLCVAARAMRFSLVDHARAGSAEKRGGDCHKITLDEGLFAVANESASLLAVDEALKNLADVDGQLAQIVELRFFGGLQHEEIAKVIGTSLRTVERGWRLARAWLMNAMDEDA